MEMFKINHAAHFWMEQMEEARAVAAEHGEAFMKYFADDAIRYNQKIEDAKKLDSGEWEAITVLYSFEHSLTGEKFHFIRRDSLVKGVLYDRAKSVHETISDEDLQKLKQDIV